MLTLNDRYSLELYHDIQRSGISEFMMHASDRVMGSTSINELIHVMQAYKEKFDSWLAELERAEVEGVEYIDLERLLNV